MSSSITLCLFETKMLIPLKKINKKCCCQAINFFSHRKCDAYTTDDLKLRPVVFTLANYASKTLCSICYILLLTFF